MRSIYRPGAIIEAWFELMPARHVPGCRALLATVQAAAPELVAVVKWGQLVFLDAGAHAFAIAPFRRHVHFQVFNGSAIDRRFPQLRGSGPGQRQLRWRHGDEIDPDLVTRIVQAALSAPVRR